MWQEQKPEVWGGFECTVARIGSAFRNEAEETGHADRLEDLDAALALGIKTLRYPALWETISAEHPDRCDWRWHDVRFGRLRDLGIRAIAGLLHHGSGPRYTSLTDPNFPGLFARHAERVAERFPWVDLFTPVNEPLTTARFSGLYGHWYPHATGMGPFLRAVVAQCKATVLGMRAIRKVTPGAQLIQTEDIGKVFGTPGLAEQASFENQRRWLSLDLLCGRVDKSHPWHPILLDHGIAEGDLALLLEADATPDVIGVNRYLTSERFLDPDRRAYPTHLWGGNGRQQYADVEAVRIDLPSSDLGPKARLREVLERYARPVAVTEAHHGSSRDEQLRWLDEVWTAATELKAEGHDLRAVTIWSLMGAVDWNSLLVSRNGVYEPGAFDVRSPAPRRTALGTAAASLAHTGRFEHPVLGRKGWWRRRERFYQPRLSEPRVARSSRALQPAKPLLITGATGTLGRAFSRICAARGLDHVLTGRLDLDITDPASVAGAIEVHRPWAVINTAGYVQVEQAEREFEACRMANTAGAEFLASACAKLGLPLVSFSSDLVFDGHLGRPYVESDPTCPTGVYGESKALAESAILACHPGALAIRASAFFGPWDRHSFAFTALRALSEGRPLEMSQNVVSPTYVPDLVHAALDLLIDGETGLWHLVNEGEVSWAEFGSRLFAEAGLAQEDTAVEQNGTARNTALSSERAWVMPTLENAIARFVRDCEVDWHAEPTMIAAE